jgi:hypothetical protein
MVVTRLEVWGLTVWRMRLEERFFKGAEQYCNAQCLHLNSVENGLSSMCFCYLASSQGESLDIAGEKELGMADSRLLRLANVSAKNKQGLPVFVGVATGGSRFRRSKVTSENKD